MNWLACVYVAGGLLSLIGALQIADRSKWVPYQFRKPYWLIETLFGWTFIGCIIGLVILSILGGCHVS